MKVDWNGTSSVRQLVFTLEMTKQKKFCGPNIEERVVQAVRDTDAEEETEGFCASIQKELDHISEQDVLIIIEIEENNNEEK